MEALYTIMQLPNNFLEGARPVNHPLWANFLILLFAIEILMPPQWTWKILQRLVLLSGLSGHMYYIKVKRKSYLSFLVFFFK